MSAQRTLAVLFVSTGLILTGCGTRVGHDEIRADAGGGTVRLDQASLDQLRAITPNRIAAGAASGPATAGVQAAPTTGRAHGPGRGTIAGHSAPGATAPTAVAATAGSTAVPDASTARAPVVARGTSGCASQGAPLVLGQVGTFSGVFGPITASVRSALAVWTKDVNAAGGLACHPVTVYTVDDGADPSRAAALTQELITDKKIQAIVAMFAPLSMSGILPVLERNKIPVVGGDAFDPVWFHHPLLFPQGAGLDAIVDGSVRQTVGSGKTRLGLLYCVESSLCTTVAKALPGKAKEAGGEVVYSSPVSVTQTDFTAQCQNAKSAGVQAFGMGVDGSTIARVARSCAALGFFPQFISGGGVISPEQAKDPGIRKDTMSTSSPNAPWMLTDTPGLQDYARALTTYAPGLQFDGNSMTAWAAAKLFQAAVANLGPAARDKPITTADILTGLGRIKNETLGGLAPPITFSPGQKSAPPMRCIYFELLTEQGWTAPKGSKYVCS